MADLSECVTTDQAGRKRIGSATRFYFIQVGLDRSRPCSFLLQPREPLQTAGLGRQAGKCDFRSVNATKSNRHGSLC